MLYELLARHAAKKATMVPPHDALPGRDSYAFAIPKTHEILGTPLQGPFPAHMLRVSLGMGCFWGAERAIWQLPGVYTTAVGYAGGYTPHPTYEEACSGHTGHTEAVLAVFDPEVLSLETLLKTFWERHDPTQGMRQGNDLGTQYRSAIYLFDEVLLERVLASRDRYQRALHEAGRSAEITTEIKVIERWYYAEAYHQQYLHKNPNGYCGLRGTGVACSIA